MVKVELDFVLIFGLWDFGYFDLRNLKANATTKMADGGDVSYLAVHCGAWRSYRNKQIGVLLMIGYLLKPLMSLWLDLL